MKSKFIDVQGKKLHYNTFLEDSFSNKPVCIFIHGASPESQHTEFWNPLFPVMQKYCQPILLDGYGHGLSEKPSPDEVLNAQVIIEIYLNFIQAIKNEEKINQFILVGRSLGGMVTHTLAQTLEHELLSIGLIAPARANKIDETLKNWIKPVSVLWDYNDPMVGFDSYATIEKTVTQVKLFVIGAPEGVKCVKNHTRKEGSKPSHVPELADPELFEEFLSSLIQ